VEAAVFLWPALKQALELLPNQPPELDHPLKALPILGVVHDIRLKDLLALSGNGERLTS
jgi:hypothetical protein